jgi:hypothetical protein
MRTSFGLHVGGLGRMHSKRWYGLSALVACVLWLVTTPPAAVAAEPDLTWAPTPFVFKPGARVRYIDFQNGNDADLGTRARPWQHHPWDPVATANAKACTTADTYCFKQGVTYRGKLTAAQSGTAERPVRLTVDPSWGKGDARFWGSLRVRGPWQRCTKEAYPELPQPDKTWWADLPDGVVPRMLWEVRDGKIVNLPLARTPNWRIIHPDDPRRDWWEFTRFEMTFRLHLDKTDGFATGDRISGSGEWEDREEDRDNLAQSKTIVTAVTDAYLEVACMAWKKGEFKEGSYVTSGKAKSKLTKVSDYQTSLFDQAHLGKDLTGDLEDAVLWLEGNHMARPLPRLLLPQKGTPAGAIRIPGQSPNHYCRYYLENRLEFLDSPGECFFEQTGGRKSQRLFVRLDGDRDPNQAQIEAGHGIALIEISSQHHIEVSGIAFGLMNSTLRYDANMHLHGSQTTQIPWFYSSAVRILGNCSHVAVRNCVFRHVTHALVGFPQEGGDILDHITFVDNDIEDAYMAGVYLTSGRAQGRRGSRLNHVRLLRNRFHNTGWRSTSGWGGGFHTIDINGGEVVEIAGNVIDRSYGAGIRALNGSDYVRDGVAHPLIRVRIHHNKVTNSLLQQQDYGGIASWMAGPSYIYNNISGNAVGYKHHQWRTLERKDWYRTSCYGVGIYIDGQYKGYVFNNIVWGKNNDVNDRIYNSCAFNEAMGFMNVVFNNTLYNCGVGLHKGMYQHNRCYYLGNLMLDIGHKFIQQEVRPSALEHHSLAYARNVMQGTPPSFGALGHEVAPSREEWQALLSKQEVMVTETGIQASGPMVENAPEHDFRPRAGTAPVDHGAKVFVPWSLYAVVGEWGFFKHPADPTVILGENVNWNDEWYFRSMYGQIPRNDLKGHGIVASSFRVGALENWADGALHLNGADQYCVLADSELRRSYDWETKLPRWIKGATSGTYDGARRATVDMDRNNFLLEVVFKTASQQASGGIVCKYLDKGYALALAEGGHARMALRFGESSCSRSTNKPVNDGKWHHLIVEVDRSKPQGINLYVDGALANGAWSGRMDKRTSLSNRGDFLVGKTSKGAAGETEAYFTGALDFLRVSRGTLADAETTIEELYEWEFNGPFLRDFSGRAPTGKGRDAGAIEHIGK